MKYKYLGIDFSGNKVSGIEHASSPVELLKRLKSKKIFCIKIKKYCTIDFQKYINFVSYKDISMFCKNMSLSLKSGMNFIDVLNLVKDRSSNKYIKNSLVYVIGSLKNGENFYNSISAYSNIYPNMLLGLINLGEKSGNLLRIFENMYKYYLNRYKLQKKVISSLIYPFIIFILGIFLQIFFMINILPVFINQFNITLNELPKLTLFYLNLSNFIISNKYIIYLTFIVTILLSLSYKYFVYNNYNFSKIVLKIPIIRDIILKSFRESFCSNMCILLESGIGIYKSYEISIESMNNKYLKNIFNDSLKHLKMGNSLGETLRCTKLFPKSFIDIISVGEEGNKVEESFNTLQYMLNYELNELLDKATSVVQPLTICIIGILVGLIILAMILPMLNMMEVAF